MDIYKKDDTKKENDNLKMAVKSERLFGTNGVRGIYGKDFTIEKIMDLSYSLATFFHHGKIAVGYDGRKSSRLISNVVTAVITSAGLDVVALGQVPTPVLQFSTKNLGCSGGIMITASHNPPEYNGIKPIASDGIEIAREDELKVEDIYYSKNFIKNDVYGKEIINNVSITSYTEKVLSLVNSDIIKKMQFKVVLDIGNGVQGLVAPYLLQQLGCNILTINSNIDGDFPGRGPEPTTTNLEMLSKMVVETNSDLGVAYDGDGDRSIFCDDKGIIYPGDKTAALLLQYLLKTRHKGAEIVCPVNTTLLVENTAKNYGSTVIYTKVGSVEVSREMKTRNAIIGLEENGGFMYGMLNEVRDGAMTTALILEMMAISNETENTNFSNTKKIALSELFSTLEHIYQYKTKFKCSSREIAHDIVKKCIMHGSPMKIDTMDGAKIWIDGETWIMVRPSGTEPLIRMYGESNSETLLESKIREYTRIVKDNLL